MIRRVAFASLVVGVLAHPASAQGTPKPVLATPQAPAIRPEMLDVPPPPPKPVAASRPDEGARAAEARRSITRANPLPARTSSTREADPDSRRDPLAAEGRFANPGGVGRYAEYYTANTPTSQIELHPMPHPRFDQWAGLDRAGQIAAFQAGQMRARNIQNNINAYGRPYGAYGAGFGLGFGLYGGGPYGGGFR